MANFLAPTQLFDDDARTNVDKRSTSLPAPSSGVTIMNQPEVYEMVEEIYEEDYEWFDLEGMLMAERDEGGELDQEGWTMY